MARLRIWDKAFFGEQVPLRHGLPCNRAKDTGGCYFALQKKTRLLEGPLE